MYSIIIPTYNRQADLYKCLDGLSFYFDDGNQEKLGFSVEVIVTDDARQVSIKEHLAMYYPWVRYFEGPGKGPAANRNNGASHAKRDWLVFIDDDCIPGIGWLEAFNEFTGSASVLEGKTIADRPKLRMDEESPINEAGGYLWSCNFVIKKSLYNQLGGFDENFPWPSMEDMDLKKRIDALNEKIIFIQEAVVIHPWRCIRENDFLSKQQQSCIYYWEKHMDERPKSLFLWYSYRALRSFLKVTVPETVKFKGRGFSRVITRDAWMLGQALKFIYYKL